MSEERLREKVREALRTGKLPDHPPERTWGGRGSGGSYCSICGDAIKADQVEFELEFSHGVNGNGSGSLHVHLRCFSAWDSEREAMAAQKLMTPTGLPVESIDGTILPSESIAYKRGAG
jgi:hypothetical protein